jgi:hypothetical protein
MQKGKIMTKIRTPKEQTVLDAARKLARVQALDIQQKRTLKAAMAKHAESAALYDEAKWDLVVADAHYASANLLSETRRRKLLAHCETYESGLHTNCHAAKEKLWTVATAEDDDVILQAAQDYAQRAASLQRYCTERDAMRSEYYVAQQAVNSAGKSRTDAVQKRGKAKAALEAAKLEINQIQNMHNSNNVVPELEQSLAATAAALTDTKPFTYTVYMVSHRGPGFYSESDGAETMLLPIEISDSRLSELVAEARADAHAPPCGKSWTSAQEEALVTQHSAAAEEPQMGSSMMSE